MAHYIPSSEITLPDLHADEIGFVFEWEGHILRGINPASKDRVLSYFSSGFIDRVCQEGLFPNTWISEYENEQFALILEHEKISPVLDSTEWNYRMLYDAAQLVLRIAEIALEYGYNMIDCHSANVLFKESKPYYVDLGSFVPNPDGCTAWRPYPSFLRSYLHLLEWWRGGANQVVKRLLSPGIELNDYDYYVQKCPVYRICPVLLRWKLSFREKLFYLAISATEEMENRGWPARLAKRFVNYCRCLPNQRIGSLQRRLRCYAPHKSSPLAWEKPYSLEPVLALMQHVSGIVVFNNRFEHLYEDVWAQKNDLFIVSVQEQQAYSDNEYARFQGKEIVTAHYLLFNGGYYIRKRLPAVRLRQQIAMIPQLSLKDVNQAKLHLQEVSQYASEGKVIVGVAVSDVPVFEKSFTPFSRIDGGDDAWALYVIQNES